MAFIITHDGQRSADFRGALKVAFTDPDRHGGMRLTEALARRRSNREFDGEPLPVEALGQLLWAAQGCSAPDGRRTAPSADRAYPLEVYVALADRLWHYVPAEHGVESIAYPGDLRADLLHAVLGQPSVHDAGAVFVFSAAHERMRQHERYAEQYASLEAGHAAQNLLLQATALGFRSTPVCFIDEPSVRHVLGLPTSERVLTLVAVGGPREGDTGR